MNRSKEKKLTITKGIAAVVFIAALILCCLFIVQQLKEKKINELLDLGNKYLSEMDYENAIVAYDQAIAIDPRCEEAYLGKAQAQYALGRYEEAVATLETGIAVVADSSRLEEYLQWILKEMSYIEDTGEYEEDIMGSAGEDETEETIERPMLLNYKEIVRMADAEENEIQLEVLGDEGNEKNYSWTSSRPESASVSDTGLVTCLPVEGYAYIYAKDSKGQSAMCTIHICSPDDRNELDHLDGIRIRTEGDSEGEDRYYALSIVKKEGEESVVLDAVGEYIYYSGDVKIPETLQFRGKELKIMGMTNSAFEWSSELDSVYIPAAMEKVGAGRYDVTNNPFYYCTNLKEVKVDENNQFLKAVDGVLYSKDGKVLYSYPAGKSDSSYTVPKEVEKVYSGAFLGCSSLKEILVEEGNVHYESIDGVLIEKARSGLIAYPIGKEQATYTVPGSVEVLDANVFYSSKLEEIDCSSISSIEPDAFRQCQELKKIVGGDKTNYITWYGESITPVEIQGISNMKNLEYMYIKLSDKQDISEFAALGNLRSLYIDIAKQALGLEALGKLTSLSELSIIGADNIEDFSWISEMDGLRELKLRVDEKFKTDLDLNGLQKLKDLRSLEISKMEELSDLSWLEKMESLRYINLKVERFTATDLTPLSNMKNLENLYIYSYSSDREELSEDVKQQIEKLKAERPAVNIKIWE